MGGGNNVVLEMVELILSLGLFSVYPRTHRRECSGLVRRLKLLLPLLEEASELRSPLSDAASNCLSELLKALHSVKTLLKDCSLGSKIFLAIESEAVMGRFHAVYDRLNHALNDAPYEELNISDEVIEQVELMKAQFKRAKRRTETQDIELAMDLMVVLSTKEDRNVDSAILQRLANKLDLRTVAELKTETKAVRELIKQRGGQVTESIQQVIDLLAKLRQMIGVAEVSMLDAPISAARLEKSPSLLIPHEFLCPITLEIMGDPVIVATGQTYERGSIQRWLASNHQTCPKSGQVLSHLTLAPNYALRNLIRQWCERNNYELPKREAYSGTTSATVLMEEVSCLVQNLSSSQLDVWRYAVIKIRLLSKESPDNRILIAKVGGIPPLVKLLSYPDAMIQEHTVTALLNLSIDEANKKLIAKEGAIPEIIKILQNGTGEARENSAAALFSLSMLDENKVLVGSLNGIPPLVSLLQNGTTRGRKDAATALFNLSLNQGNKSRAIKAGIIPPLLRLLEDKSLGMINEALSILSLLLSHPEGRDKVGGPSFIETLVEIIGNGTPKNKECAASVLLELGSNDLSTILAALRFGAYEHLVQISRCGTTRAQRKASSLLQHISKCDQVVA